MFKDFKVHVISILTFIRIISFNYSAETRFRDSTQLPFDMVKVGDCLHMGFNISYVKKTGLCRMCVPKPAVFPLFLSEQQKLKA